MATLTKRNGKWQARVRRVGHPTKAQSFETKADAQRWIRAVEAEQDNGGSSTQPAPHDVSVAELLTRYERTVSAKKRGSLYETNRIRAFLRYDWAALPLSETNALVFSRFRDLRLRHVAPGTVIRELGLLRSIFETAIRDWSVPLTTNPLARIRKPRAPEGRTRRLRVGELSVLLKPSSVGRCTWLRTAILLAVETGMRRGELLAVKWQHIDFDTSVLSIPVTKTGFARRIPLTQEAAAIFSQARLQTFGQDDRVIPVTGHALEQAWKRCRKRASEVEPEIVSLRFHDLRHEAVSRFFEIGLNTAEVALISGHRDPRMLFRYTHLKPEDIAAKLKQTHLQGRTA